MRAFIVALILGVDIAASQNVNSAKKIDPLEGAILEASNFAPEERAHFYVDLILKFQNSRDSRLKGWIERTLEIARELPPNWNRVAIEKNAITALARVDAGKAFEGLTLLTATPKDEFGARPEDLRANAASTVFVAAFKAGVSIGRIVEAGTALSTEGDFPFDGLGRVLAMADAEVQGDAVRLAAFQAASLYRISSFADNCASEYGQFVRQVWPKLSVGERVAILEPLLNHLEIVGGDSKDSTLSKLVLKSGETRLNKAQGSRLIADLKLPESEFTQAQRERWLKLKSALLVDAAGGESLGVVAVNPKVEASAESIGKASAKVQERGEARWISRNLDAEPAVLFRRLSKISSLDLRYDAIAAIIPKLSAYPDEAKDLMAQMKTIEESKLAPEIRLRVLRSKIRRDSKCELTSFDDLVRSGVGLADELFSKSYDAAISRPAYDHPGFEESMEIVERASSCDAAKGLALANRISHRVLRTYGIVVAVPLQ